MVLKTEFGRVEMFFPAANEHRHYALKTAPLRRVVFKEADSIKTHEGQDYVVTTVENKAGLLIYHTEQGRAVAEAELSDTISFSKPEDRLLAAQVDDLRTYALRTEALTWRNKMQGSQVRGFVGGRVDMIPHQMFIAGEVSRRLSPRVLLADEVGLGKTIEAGLIMHRLHLTGRASRVLILVPEPLIHQWFVELLRRFNMLFSIFDEDRCVAIEEGGVGTANPFSDSQLVLCPVSLLANDPIRAKQAIEIGWDMLIVDEAHHLQWSPEKASIEYELVAALAAKTPGLLLLTATPQQLGPEGHFARLRLLDADRYTDLAQFVEESAHYEEVASALDRLLDGKALSKADKELFGSKSERIREHCDAIKKNTDEATRMALVNELLDTFGTGRVMFRNTRAALSGFPVRKALLEPLKADKEADENTVKVKWLAKLLKELGETTKVLAICRTRALAEQIHEMLLHEINLSAGLFHEGMNLMQRDRAAAHFANEEEGARLLICSEIGSEGRNFQFAHHLVLFDLPEDPELLEQRIGRLDRIGQKAVIQIHVPYVKGSAGEVLARWYHEGLNAFEKNVHGATEIATTMRDELTKAMAKPPAAAGMKTFLKKAKDLHGSVTQKLERGHDRLLELNSCKPQMAATTIGNIRACDADEDFEEFFVRLLDYFGMHIEELGSRSYFIQPANLLTDKFPSVPDEGMTVTFDRTRALSREHIGFLTWDHPIVRGALDTLLSSEDGNSAFAMWRGGGSEAIMLEVHYVLECVAPPSLHIERFMPATPIRILVDHAGADHSADDSFAKARMEKGAVAKLLEKPAVKRKLMPDMLKKAQQLAVERVVAINAVAQATMNGQLLAECERLEQLSQINNHVKPEDIAALKLHRSQLASSMNEARLKLDSVRLILRLS